MPSANIILIINIIYYEVPNRYLYNKQSTIEIKKKLLLVVVNNFVMIF